MKLSRALFDRPNSDKDPLGYGHNEHWTEATRYGMAPTMAERRRKIKTEVWVVVFVLLFTIGFALVLEQARAEAKFQKEITR